MSDLYLSVTSDEAPAGQYRVLKTNVKDAGFLIRTEEILSLEDRGIEIYFYTKAISRRTGQYTWKRVWTEEQKKNHKEQRAKRWMTAVENIRGRIPFPKEFGFSTKYVGNCGVVAFAIATKTPYEVMYEHFRQMSKKPGKWKGSTYRRTYGDTLSKFGTAFTKTDEYKGMKLYDFVKYYAAPRTTYVVCSYNHVMIVRGKYVIDQRGAMPIDAMNWGSKSVIQDVWIIKDKPTKIRV